MCVAPCNTITSVPTPVMEMSQLICGGCCTLLMSAHGATSVRCSCCHTVNLAPAHNIAHVNCGNCCTTLMYPYGAPSVKCSVCQYITNVNMGNVRVPIAMLRSNGATSSASMPSSSADLPNSQSQTVVVENPMSVDKSGKLALSVLQWIKNDLLIVAVLESKEQFMMLSSVGTSGIEMRFCILREKVSYWPCYFLVLLLYFLTEMLKEL